MKPLRRSANRALRLRQRRRACTLPAPSLVNCVVKQGEVLTVVWLKQASRHAAEGLLGLAHCNSGSALVEVR